MLNADSYPEIANLCHNLAVLRQRSGLSLRTMAKILHTTPYVVHMLEKGMISMHFDVMSILYARVYFQVSYQQLFDTRL